MNMHWEDSFVFFVRVYEPAHSSLHESSALLKLFTYFFKIHFLYKHRHPYGAQLCPNSSSEADLFTCLCTSIEDKRAAGIVNIKVIIIKWF